MRAPPRADVMGMGLQLPCGHDAWARIAAALAALCIILACLPTATSGMGDPYYADPLFDGAHDAEFVWHEGEQVWWVIYLQNRYNSPIADPAGSCAYCVYTDFGLASTPDGGRSWVYRGVADGMDVPIDLRNNSLPSTRPPAAASQMYGGATWWRPAVVRHGGMYHGFFVYNPDPGDGMHSCRIVHYTSDNLKTWHFAEVARSEHPSAYDRCVCHHQCYLPRRPPGALEPEPTCMPPHHGACVRNSNVFKIADGRWILFSTDQTRPRYGSSKPLQSQNLYNWTTCDDADLQINVGEGPHVTGSSLNDATTAWNGYAWMNWEWDEPDGRTGIVMRSADKGLTVVNR